MGKIRNFEKCVLTRESESDRSLVIFFGLFFVQAASDLILADDLNPPPAPRLQSYLMYGPLHHKKIAPTIIFFRCNVKKSLFICSHYLAFKNIYCYHTDIYVFRLLRSLDFNCYSVAHGFS